MHFCMMFKKGTFCPVRNMFFFTLVFNNVNKCMHKPNACTSKNSLKKTQKKKLEKKKLKKKLKKKSSKKKLEKKARFYWQRIVD